MVVALVFATFVLFVLVDFYLQRRRPQPAQAVSKQPEISEPSFPLSMVGGFKLPAHLSYHAGHVWAMKETQQLVRIGLDDFAARLAGHFDQVELPARGRWLRQGEHGWTVARRNHRFEMLSPIEGEVVDVNEAVLRDPSLVQIDPYGKGWLLAVNAPAADGNLKNLMRGRLACHWMEESVAMLQTRLSPGGEARLQDGGHAIADLLAEVPEERWERIVGELFLS